MLVGAQGGKAQVRRSTAIVVGLVAFAVVLPLAARPVGGAGPELRPPVIDGDWPDPEVVLDEDTRRYYAYATNFGVFGLTVNVPVRSSRDLVDWSTFEGDALPTLPGWATPDKTWSPGVARIAGRWLMYFTATETASGHQCIGVARADAPTGPFVPIGSEPLVCQRAVGGSIDASPFQDPTTGYWYLHWKSDENASGGGGNPRLFGRRLTGGGTVLSGSSAVLLSDTRPGVQKLIENPDMVFDDGRYWMVFSMNDWNSAGYAAHLARCERPMGPCTWVEPSNPPWLQSDSDSLGTGGASFFRDRDGRAHVAFHGWREAVGYEEGGRRATHIEPITFSGPGNAPVIRTDRPKKPSGSPTPYVAYGRFVDAAYQAFLGRPPGAPQRYEWTLRLLDGYPRGEFIRRLATSDAWLGHEIDQLYRTALGRPADAAGREYWRQKVIDGMRLADVGAYFYASEEYYQRAGGTRTGFVSALYRDILHRPPDDSGLAFWTGLLRSGTTRVEVAEAFYVSIESRRDRVVRLYRALLGRRPDAGGLAYWAGVLLDVDDVFLAEFLASSDEFFDRAQR